MSYMEIDSVEKAMTILQQIIDNDRDVEAEDFLNLSQLQDMSGMYAEANKTERNIQDRRLERLVSFRDRRRLLPKPT